MPYFTVIKGTPKKSLIGKSSKDTDKSHVHRRQKCLSHPTSFTYSCSHIDKTSLADGFESENEKHPVKEVSLPSDVKTKYEREEVNSSSSDIN